MAQMTEEMKIELRNFMELSGFSQEEISRQIGVSLMSLNGWLRGRQVKMNGSTFKLVQNFLNEIRVKVKK
jgi:transcriptional regulator with XRE-family HTH domain